MTTATKTAHTPGPWALEANEVRAGDNLIADVMGGEGTRFIDDKDNTECLANARLIAAAPELLEACEIALTFLESHSARALWPKSESVAALSAAIAKATAQ